MGIYCYIMWYAWDEAYPGSVPFTDYVYYDGDVHMCAWGMAWTVINEEGW